MKFQIGNKFGGRKEKPFRDALLMELKAAGEDHKALRLIARALIKEAQSGNVQAIREFGDRTDGRVPQEAKIEMGPLASMSEDELRDTLAALNAYLGSIGQNDDRAGDETETRH